MIVEVMDRTPAEVFPPGEFIREEIEARGWSQVELAEILGRLFCLKEHGTRPHLSHHRAKLSHAGSQLPYPGASDQPLHHCYFYIWDQVLGPILIRVASFFPFLATNWLNGTLS